MAREQWKRLRRLEGRRVNVALADGDRLDDCHLVSYGRHGTSTLWVFHDGDDRFIAREHVVDVWEVPTRSRAA